LQLWKSGTVMFGILKGASTFMLSVSKPEWTLVEEKEINGTNNTTTTIRFNKQFRFIRFFIYTDLDRH